MSDSNGVNFNEMVLLLLDIVRKKWLAETVFVIHFEYSEEVKVSQDRTKVCCFAANSANSIKYEHV